LANEHLSTHILDISTGKPAEGVTVHLERDGLVIATGVTNAQGRIAAFVAHLPAGRYRLVAEIGAWFSETGRETIYPARRLIL
jgi:5-hydroxyisourate hydrolase